MVLLSAVGWVLEKTSRQDKHRRAAWPLCRAAPMM
jgi:hypothetical protein